MTSGKKRDALLITAKVATILVRAALVIAMIGVVIGIAAISMGGLGMLPEAVQIELGGDLQGATVWVLALAMIAALVVLALSYDFTARLARIIDTVGEGDPFIMDNAVRLNRMAWLALAVQIVSIPASLLGSWAEMNPDEGTFQLQSDVSLTGLALALLLFILARVFREGARMREELEGTV